MKDNKGITLVALVITIIVLLILAGVTVASLSGEDGLLTRGSQAVNRSNVADAEEKVTLAFDNIMTGFYEEKYAQGKSSLEPVQYVHDKMTELIAKDGELEGVCSFSTVEDGKFTITLTGFVENSKQEETKTPITAEVSASGNSAKLGAWTNSESAE